MYVCVGECVCMYVCLKTTEEIAGEPNRNQTQVRLSILTTWETVSSTLSQHTNHVKTCIIYLVSAY